ncbi:MAG TPA: hypothetical protein VJ461_06855 [Candidatus Nanoarchaeia archaeon]|nr:hypothetical protein [Candidatus Nanoarchaeia archaeon]
MVRGKRGKSALALLFYTFFTLIIAALFVLAVLGKVKSAVNDSNYHKKFYSRDLALLVDSLHTANGKFVMDYDFNTSEKMPLDINLEVDKVILTDRTDKPVETRAQTVFLFGYNDYVKVKPASINQGVKKFKIVAENKTITFQNNNT